MVLKTLIDNIENIARDAGLCNSFIVNDITRLNTDGEIIYPCIGVTQNQHSSDDYDISYNLNIFYVDRLVDNWEGNDLEIQSDGIVVLNTLVKLLKENLDLIIDEKTFTSFNERFTDECSGVFMQCTITSSIITECI